MYELVEEVRARLRGTGALAVGYGHVGDGNLHLNVSAAKPDARVLGAHNSRKHALRLTAPRRVAAAARSWSAVKPISLPEAAWCAAIPAPAAE